jgi:hypothetical protein
MRLTDSEGGTVTCIGGVRIKHLNCFFYVFISVLCFYVFMFFYVFISVLCVYVFMFFLCFYVFLCFISVLHILKGAFTPLCYLQHVRCI